MLLFSIINKIMTDINGITHKLSLQVPKASTANQLMALQVSGDKFSQQQTTDANNSQRNSPSHQKCINNIDFHSRYSSILKEQFGNKDFKRVNSNNQKQGQTNTAYKPFILTLRNLTRRLYKQSGITVMLKTEYPIIYNLVYKYFNFKFYNKEDHHHDIFLIWMDTYVSEQFVKRLKSYQRINHFPSSCELGRKDLLSTNLKMAKQIMPEQYQFYPNTWILPKEHDTFYSQFSKEKYYIVKPHANCQGRGIYLAKNPNINRKEEIIVQEYIPNPMLIQGSKFDLRIYVLLRSLQPLRIYVYKEGLCRLATTKYVVPDESNLKNQKMHLTNYAINKLAPSFVGNKSVSEESQGHKRSYTSALKYLQNMGFDVQKIEDRIESIIIRTFMAGYTKMSNSYKKSREFNSNFKQNRQTTSFRQDNHIKNNTFNSQQPSVCFQLFGFDIMLLDTGEPILLEINHQPSLVTDSPFDLAVKKCLIMDTINLLSIEQQDKGNWQKCQSEGIMYRNKYLQLKQLQNMGGYKRVYPIYLQKRDSAEIQKLQNSKILYESIFNKFINRQMKGINKIKMANYKTISYRPGTRQNNSSKQITVSSKEKQSKTPNSNDKTRVNRSITTDQGQKAVALTFYNLFNDAKYHIKRGPILMPQEGKQDYEEDKVDKSIKKHLFFAELVSQRQKNSIQGKQKKFSKFQKSFGYENLQNQYRQKLQINTLHKTAEKKTRNEQKELQNVILLQSNQKFKQCLFSTKNRGIMHYINSQRKKRKIQKDNVQQNVDKQINRGSIQKRGNQSESKYQSERQQSLDADDLNSTGVGGKIVNGKLARQLSAEQKIEQYRHIYGKSIREKMQRINNIKLMKNQIKKFNFNNFLTKSNKIKLYNRQEESLPLSKELIQAKY